MDHYKDFIRDISDSKWSNGPKTTQSVAIEKMPCGKCPLLPHSKFSGQRSQGSATQHEYRDQLSAKRCCEAKGLAVDKHRPNCKPKGQRNRNSYAEGEDEPAALRPLDFG